MILLSLSTTALAAEAPYNWGTTGVSDTSRVQSILQITDNLYDDGPVDGSNPTYSYAPLPWDKDGEWIVYTAQIDALSQTNKEICKIKKDGTGFAKLTVNNVEDSNASFGSDGKIYFERNDSGLKIYRMNNNGSGEENLTDAHTGSSGEGEVRPSPDAAKIAYRYNNRLYVADSDGKNPVQVSQETPLINLFDGYQFDWSPDSQWIVYNGYVTQYAIYKVKPDGTGHAQITTPGSGVSDYRPAWSPDGSKIAFNRYNSSGVNQLIMMNPDGTGSVLLDETTGNWTLDYYGPISWNPDSKWLAYTKYFNDSVNPTYKAIFIINIATKTAYQLTTDYYDYVPFWSPAGNQILFQDSSSSSRDDSDVLGFGTNNQADMLIINLIGDYGSSVQSFPWPMFMPAVQNGSKK
jgi:Tol biopolymer transport system component